MVITKMEIWLITVTLAHFGFAQSPFDLEGGEIHSVGSTIFCTFSTTIPRDLTRVIFWKINQVDVCFIRVQRNVITGQSCESSSVQTYYHNNSAIESSSLSTENLLSARFSYKNIQPEIERTNLTVWDAALVGKEYNKTFMTVETCPVIENTERTSIENCSSENDNTFGCVSLFKCSATEGYDGQDVEAVCQADAAWNATISCTRIQCVVNDSSDACCYNKTGVIDFGETVEGYCCSNDADRMTYTCENRSAIVCEQDCPTTTPTFTAATTGLELSTVTEFSAGTGSIHVSASSTDIGVEGGGLSESQKAAISIGCLYLVEGIVALVITLALKYGLVTPCIPVYIVSSVLAIPGTFMAAFGNEPKDFDGVEIAGIVFGAVGLAGMLGGVIWQCIQGVKETDYSKGSK